MTNSEFLLTAILIQQGLVALAWVGLFGLGLARRASGHWAVAAALVAAALGLSTLRLTGGNPWLSFFAANSLAVLAYVTARRGVQVFCDIRRTDLEHLVLFGVYVLVFAPMVASGQREWHVIAWTSLFTGYLLTRMGLESLEALRSEFGDRTAWACTLPSLGVGAMFLARALASPLFVNEVGRSLVAPGVFNARFALVLMGASLLLNIGLMALVVVRAVRDLQRLSDHDALTGALNRRGFEGALVRERARLARGGAGFALLSLDVDHFKRINDLHGHAHGDKALVAVAQVLQATVRQGDALARTGGEEFIVLLPQTGLAEARLTAHRLLDAVREQAHVAAGLPTPMTVSIGVIVSTEGDEAIDSLLRRLDEMLYRAKADGRDRVAMLAECSTRVA